VAVTPDLHQPVILRLAQTTTQCTRIHIPSTPNSYFGVGRITNNPLTSSPSPYPLTTSDLDFEQAFCQIPGAGSSHSLSGVHYLRHPRNETLRPGYSFCTRNRRTCQNATSESLCVPTKSTPSSYHSTGILYPAALVILISSNNYPVHAILQAVSEAALLKRSCIPPLQRSRLSTAAASHLQAKPHRFGRLPSSTSPLH
jgi:hypothetical protein